MINISELMEDLLLRLIANKIKDNHHITLTEEEFIIIFDEIHRQRKELDCLNDKQIAELNFGDIDDLACEHGFYDCTNCSENNISSFYTKE